MYQSFTIYKDHMNKRWILWLVTVLLLAGCKEVVKDGKSTISTLAPPTSGTGAVTQVAINGGSTFTHTQEIGTTKSDVFFIYTNPSSSQLALPSFSSLANQASPAQSALPAAPQQSLVTFAKSSGIGLRGTQEISEFNTRPPKMIPRRGSAPKASLKPQFAVVGDSYSFMTLSSSEIVTSTLRGVITDGTITANLWVADDSWGSCAKTSCLTQAMVDGFGAKFLKAGAGNDIYDWVTNIYGLPWGAQSFTNLIDATAANSIDILFYDISADNSSNGGVLGFFYAKDNYLISNASSSNQRLMFYIDSVLTATATGDTWEISDLWPAEMVATLAHEFQHMIHFYQKTVLKDAGTASSQSWIHEMMSMMTEDLVADKILADGPRGIAYGDGTSGSAGNNLGRPALFNSYGYISQATWANDNLVLARYAINYSFGAWLSRNYGGVLLAQQLIKSDTDDLNGLIAALAALGYTVTYDELLQQFWAAVVLSDLKTNVSPFMMNSGAYFTSTLNSIDYNLGSLNFYNYNLGPQVYSSTGLSSSLSTMLPYSGIITQAGSNVSGTLSSTVTMPRGVNMTVVVKPH